MKSGRGHQTVGLSVLDRLRNGEADAPEGQWISRGESLSRLKQSLRRDLEWLLNTRSTRLPRTDLRELNRSVFVYGMPELSAYALDSAADRARLLNALGQAIERFEPRLCRVAISPLENETHSHALRFRIEGWLRTEAALEPVSFDTVLELSSGEYQVKGER